MTDRAFAERLWRDSGLQDMLASEAPELFRHATGLSANIRLYRYAEGSFFGRHFDDTSQCPETGARTQWTLLIYLTGEEDGVRGGQTAFYTREGRKGPEVEHVAPLHRGTALLHAHGADCLPHEGKPVLAGTKLVLRSDVLFASR